MSIDTNIDTDNIPTETRGIYYVQGIENENKAKIIPAHIVDMYKGQQIPDKFIKRFTLFDNVIAEIYECNILDTFLQRSKKLPVMYVRVVIDRKVQKILLIKLSLYFTITSDVKSAKELFNNELEGIYTLEIFTDNKNSQLSTVNKFFTVEDFHNEFIRIISNDVMIEFIKDKYNIINEKIAERFYKEYDTAPPKISK